MTNVKPAIVCLLTAAFFGASVDAQSQTPDRGQACFFSRDFQQWRAPDPKTIIIRVSLNHFYRLDLSTPCPALTFPDSHLVSVFHGSDTICRPIDWDIRVAQPPAGVTEQCIVQAMTPMTPEQVAALPPRFRP